MKQPEELKVKNPFRKCPVCMHDSCWVLQSLAMSLPLEYSIPDNYDVVSCRKCGFVYADTSATLEDYEQYYRTANKYSAEQHIEEETKIQFDLISGILQTHLSPDFRILDMGCAKGIFGTLLRDIGFPLVFGIDPCEESIEALRRSGGAGWVGSVYDKVPAELSASFDAIVFGGVFEHLLDLRKCVERAKEYLAENGLLLVYVPDASAYPLNPAPITYYFNHEHINHFNAQTLNNLMIEMGNKAVSTYTYTVRFGSGAAGMVLSIFRKGAAHEALVPDDDTRQRVLEYFEAARTSDEKTIEKINSLCRSQVEVCIWGAGAKTMHLLGNSNLGDCNLKYLVDMNKQKVGTRLGNLEVRSPHVLKAFQGTIIVCTNLYNEQILQIISEMKLSNEVITL